MKIAVLSDTHITSSEDRIPKKVLNSLKDVDLILHAGDLTDMSVLNELRSLGKTIAVYGNMDSLEAKRTLLDKEIIEINNFKIGLTHGTGHPARIIEYLKEVFRKDKVDVIIFGHTHIPFNETIDGILFFNPGSLLDKIFAQYNSYGILEINDKIKGEIIKV